jgi:hypothetical protein
MSNVTERKPTIVRKQFRGALSVSVLLLILGSYTGASYSAERAAESVSAQGANHMFVIERNIEGAGKLSPAELRDISRKSRDVLKDLGPSIQWVQLCHCG